MSVGPAPAIVILAAGQGTRMRSSRPKVMHQVAGRAMLAQVLAVAESLEPASITVVIGPDMEDVAGAVHPHATVVQEERRGTGDALARARTRLGEGTGPLLVLYGDCPLVERALLVAMLERFGEEDQPAAVVFGAQLEEPGQYGRLVTDAVGRLMRIVEAADATPEESHIKLCNGGFMVLERRGLWQRLDRLQPANAKGELYLTDLIAQLTHDDERAAVVEGDPANFLGVNTRAELARAEAILQARLRVAALDLGVTMMASETVFFSHDTRLAPDVEIEPHVVFGPGVSVATEAKIRAFSHLEGVNVGEGAVIGPYARLRPGSEIAEGARVGNFVEVKNARLGPGAKANHLSYLGDADIGAGANIGAGTITCNYDGYAKHRTTIGADAFIGSNSALVAPVSVGEAAIVGAGSTITRNVPSGALSVARGRQHDIEDWARRFHERHGKADRSS